VCDPIGSFLLILGDGEGEVSIQEISLVLVVNVFPPEAQFLFSSVLSRATGSSRRDVLVSRVDRYRDGLVQVQLVCRDGDVDVHGSHDAGPNSPVALLLAGSSGSLGQG